MTLRVGGGQVGAAEVVREAEVDYRATGEAAS
jgi:hypothetical protein